ncbi:hypothetical protein NOF04DRAFT_11606 [Fusarium oxysporum II5]|uniref:Uncharacterized protein n=1 Tax=Fusarium odoratissimum (strain NRRL 54006) TaxID=1089451 RepID=X0KB79_FUSO5|nr:uncharacterized protein FOIG_12827 [Fusarium odoratissimum NRRL 54006]EXL94249.1 hypothetical protein FOIG_12827 [Fusarium odoratissimum NRRL 54006]KAK2135179.1 hypothetical protein NOF04DRAFT_11606 [Fusarium oxysporum II5]
MVRTDAKRNNVYAEHAMNVCGPSKLCLILIGSQGQHRKSETSLKRDDNRVDCLLVGIVLIAKTMRHLISFHEQTLDEPHLPAAAAVALGLGDLRVAREAIPLRGRSCAEEKGWNVAAPFDFDRRCRECTTYANPKQIFLLDVSSFSAEAHLRYMPSDEAWKKYESGETEEKEKVSWDVTVSSHRYLRYFRHRRIAWNRGAVVWVSLRSPSRTEVEGLDYGQSPGEKSW